MKSVLEYTWDTDRSPNPGNDSFDARPRSLEPEEPITTSAKPSPSCAPGHRQHLNTISPPRIQAGTNHNPRSSKGKWPSGPSSGTTPGRGGGKTKTKHHPTPKNRSGKCQRTRGLAIAPVLLRAKLIQIYFASRHGLRIGLRGRFLVQQAQ